MNVNQPLTVEVTDGQLIIRIGVETLKCVADNMDANFYTDTDPFLDDGAGFRRRWVITDVNALAADVRSQLLLEAEDGTTKLHLLFDAACLAAIEDGTTGADEVDYV